MISRHSLSYNGVRGIWLRAMDQQGTEELCHNLKVIPRAFDRYVRTGRPSALPTKTKDADI